MRARCHLINWRLTFSILAVAPFLLCAGALLYAYWDRTAKRERIQRQARREAAIRRRADLIANRMEYARLRMTREGNVHDLILIPEADYRTVVTAIPEDEDSPEFEDLVPITEIDLTLQMSQDTSEDVGVVENS